MLQADLPAYGLRELPVVVVVCGLADVYVELPTECRCYLQYVYTPADKAGKNVLRWEGGGSAQTTGTGLPQCSACLAALQRKGVNTTLGLFLGF